jgi:hypothetical protein
MTGSTATILAGLAPERSSGAASWASVKPHQPLGGSVPGQRGATLAVHSTLGHAGGFLGPLALGVVLDWLGGVSVLGWGVAFGRDRMPRATAPDGRARSAARRDDARAH